MKYLSYLIIFYLSLILGGCDSPIQEYKEYKIQEVYNVQIKNGAQMIGLQIEMRPVLVIANRMWKKYKQELVITEGTGGTHSAGSLHYYGYALDFRTRYFDKPIQKKIRDELALALGSQYDVILHSSHIHVEYDPK